MLYKVLFLLLLSFFVLSGCSPTVEVVREDTPKEDKVLFADNDPKKIVQEAKTYYDKGQFQIALEGYKKAADMGEAIAQNNLGFMYYDGKGVTQNFTQAVKWFRKAAQQGLADAQYNIARMYQTGKGVEQDVDQAVHWYFKAAKQGDAKALSYLGQIDPSNPGVSQAFKQAKQQFEEQAEKGDTQAQKNLRKNLFYQG
ncbi:Sel1-like repeat [Beggiatoa sp. PS]|nr:Sel1-like repeat [Beggiatoa sp. PS]